MSARRLRSSVYNNHGSQGCKGGAGGSGAWDSADSRSFPRFQPMEAGGRRNEDCPPRGKQMPVPVMPCTRSHAIKLQGGSEVQQVSCSSHPNVASCCSARPPMVVSERRPGGSRGGSRRPPYPLPAPLGKYAGTKPLASLTSIYKEPVAYDCDADEEKGWEEGEERAEEGSVADVTASHSCPISSDSPEPRPSCCRRQQTIPTPLQLQVLLRDTQPANAHHQAEMPSRRAAKARKPVRMSSFGKLLQRKRSKTQPPETEPSQLEPQPQPQQPQEKQHRRHQSVSAEPEQVPPPRQPVTLPERQAPRQQPQRHVQPQQYMHYQRNQHQMQCPSCPSAVLEHGRTRSMPLLNDDGIYGDCSSDNEEFYSKEEAHQLYGKDNVSQHQHIFRRPFSELMRSQDSIVYRRGSWSSFVSEV